MPLPFFCAICDKPIVPCKHRKHNLIDERFIGQGLEQGVIRSKTALQELLNYF